MKTYYADKELNEKYYPMFEDDIMKQECYDNTFSNVHHMNLHEKDLKVFIGFVQIFAGHNLYTRHACYLVGDKIIDLTLMKTRGSFDKLEGCEYVPLSVMTVDEYFEALWIEHDKSGTTGLAITLRAKELEMTKSMFESGQFII